MLWVRCRIHWQSLALRLLSTLIMPLYDGLPLPPVPGDWALLPEWARVADPYRACPVLTTSKAAGVVAQSECRGSLSRSAPMQMCPRPKPSCAPALHLPFSAFGRPPGQSASNTATDESQVDRNFAGDVWKEVGDCKASCSLLSDLQTSKRMRTKPPPPLAAPPAKPVGQCDPDTTSGRTLMAASALQGFVKYSEGSYDNGFLAMWNHVRAVQSSKCSECVISNENQMRLASFLAAARVRTTSVGMAFETMQLHEHRVWVLPLLKMWMPASGSPKSLVASRMYTYFFAHATDDAGLLGILQYQKMRKSFSSEDFPTHCSSCVATNDIKERVSTIVKCWLSSKNVSGVVVVGMAATDEPHRKVESGGVFAGQQACARAKVVHIPRGKQWCIHPDASQILGLAVVQTAPLQPNA